MGILDISGWSRLSRVSTNSIVRRLRRLVRTNESKKTTTVIESLRVVRKVDEPIIVSPLCYETKLSRTYRVVDVQTRDRCPLLHQEGRV